MRKRPYFILIIIALLIAAAVFYFLTLRIEYAEVAENNTDTAETYETRIIKADTQEYFKDNKALYDYDPLEVTCMYVTVVEGNEASDTDHTFAEVNSFVQKPGETGVKKILSNAIVQVGNEDGPQKGELGYGAVGANATINVRGKSSTTYPQKSYKLKLFDNAGQWKGQSTIALNKHPADVTRMRNAIYYRMMRDIPGLMSLRTFFVHLYICDETASGDGSHAFKDCGLYTAVEQPNGRTLQNHGLTKTGSLYKAFQCEMYRYEDNIKLITDPDYDQEKFEEILEPKDTNDHSKLIEMLDAVNDYTIPIEEIVDKYFDKDNLLDYLAYNMLMLNPDSNAQNYYLYSAPNSDKWYYICWDGDACLDYSEMQMIKFIWGEGKWSEGVGNYWSVVLFNRMLHIKSYRDELTERVKYYHENVVTNERVEELISEYETVVGKYITVDPDKQYINYDFETRDTVLGFMPEDVDRGYQMFLDSMKKPMPFYIGDVQKTDNGKLHFEWDPAYDFSGEIVSYRLEISSDPTFPDDRIIYSEEMLYSQSDIDMLPEGDYYFRVIAKNTSGYEGTAFDSIEYASEKYLDGGRMFSVEEDGTVENYGQ